MAEDYFSDSDDAPESSAAPEEAGAEDESGSGQTALLPKDFFQGKSIEPGKRCEVEIVKGFDEVQVKYVPHRDKEEAKEQPENAMTALLED